MQNILVPTDFSESATAAVLFAAQLSEKTTCKVHLLTIAQSMVEEDLAEIEEKLELTKQEYLAKSHEVFTHLYQEGGISDKILECAGKIKADLIIMGSHGSSSVTDILLGSNTEKVVKQSDFKVLTIKHTIQKTIKSIAFASDFSHSSNAVFQTVRDFADIFDAEIHLLKINTPTHFEPTRVSMEKINFFLANQQNQDMNNFNYQVGLYSDSTEELGILNYSMENEIDLIAVGTHKYSFWQVMFESTSQNLVNHSFRPVLTIPFDE